MLGDVIRTERLVLRPIGVEDLTVVQTAAGRREVAYHMVRNPTSGRVLSRLGFQVEGLLRQRVRKWGLFEDVVLQALLRSEWSDTVGPPGC